jgi:hypothetical protein
VLTSLFSSNNSKNLELERQIEKEMPTRKREMLRCSRTQPHSSKQQNKNRQLTLPFQYKEHSEAQIHVLSQQLPRGIKYNTSTSNHKDHLESATWINKEDEDDFPEIEES